MTVKKTNIVKEEKEVKVDTTNELLLNKIIELEKRIASQSTSNEVLAVKDSNKRSPLQSKKVIIEPINKGTSAVVPFDSAQATMLLSTNRSIICPIDKSGRLVDPLEEWEKEYLEETTSLDLNIYSDKCFYKKAVIKFHRVGRNLDSASVVLNLNDPYQYILYKISLKSPLVANKWEDRHNMNYSYVIRDNDAQLAEDITYTDKADTVLKYIIGIKKNKKSLFNLLRLYGNNDTLPVKVDYNKSVEWLYQQVRKITETRKGTNTLFNIVSVENDAPNRMYTMVLLEDAVSAGAIIKKGRKYSTKGGDIIGYDISEACVFLENAENTEYKLWVSIEVEKYFKNK